MKIIKEKAKITSKYQITLPKIVRQSLKLEQSDQVEFNILPDGSVLVQKVNTDNDFWQVIQEQEQKYGSISTDEIEWDTDQGSEIID